MLRKSLLLVVVAALVCAAVPAEAQSKARKKDAPRVLKAGDEVSVYVAPEMLKPESSEVKAGVVGPDYRVLPVMRQASPDDTSRDFSYDFETSSLLIQAGQVGDRIGVDNLLSAKRAVKLNTGTKLIVTFRFVGSPDCRARVVDGENVGRIVEIRLKNLR